MKKTRKGTSGAANERSSTRGKRPTESSRRSGRKATPSDSHQKPNSNIRDLPPNKNIRKRSDEVYGDTEIPERKPGT
jgi:hypothetical protein